MADDKSKRGSPDRNLISFKEKYESDYAAKQLQNQVVDATPQEAKEAPKLPKRRVQGPRKVMRAARKIFRD
jgi:hypothetical protein